MLVRVEEAVIKRFCKLMNKTLLKSENRSEIVMFHDIVSCEKDITDNYTCSEKQFKDYIMSELHKGKTISSLPTVLSQDANRAIEGQIVVTFDDGFESVYHTVSPWMFTKKLPFTVFVTTSFIDKPGYLSRQQIKLLSNNPLCTIGMHAHQHKAFRGASDEELEKDYDICKKILTEITGNEPSYFAFPYGSVLSCSMRNVKTIKKKEVDAILMTLPIGLTKHAIRTPFYLPRINIPATIQAHKTNGGNRDYD